MEKIEFKDIDIESSPSEKKKGMGGALIGRLDAHRVEKIEHKGIDPESQCP